MKTISAAFTLEQNKPDNFPLRQLYYKRRYWNETTKLYVWEADWNLLSESEVVSVSSVNWALDTNTLNEFKISNVTLTLKNVTNKWKTDNRAGIFTHTSITPVDFTPYWMKFQVRAGYNLSDGSNEALAIFTGVATEYQYDNTEGQVQITVSGLETLLQNADAQRVGLTITNETLGTGNGALTAFPTAHNGVILSSAVRVGGLTKKLGVDYDISNLGVAGTPATVTFTVAPVSGTITIDYVYGLTNQNIDDLVALLCTEAGITLTDIQSVLFASTLANSWTQTTQAEWNTGTLTRLNSTLVADSLVIEADDPAHTALLDGFTGALDAAWVQAAYSGGDGGTFSNVSNENLWTATGTFPFQDAMQRPSNRAYGRWQLRIKNLLSGPSQGSTNQFFLTANNWQGTDHTNATLYNGYVLSMGFSVGANACGLALYRQTQFSLVPIGSTFNFTRDTNYHDLRAVRYTNGYFAIYWDNVLVISGTDNTITTSTYTGFVVGSSGIVSSTAVFNMDDFYTPTATMTGDYVTQYLDAGPSVTNWGVLSFTQLPAGGAGQSITPVTRSSPDHITWDSYLALGTGNAPQSDTDRYFQVKFSFLADTTKYSDPELQDMLLQYSSLSTFITLANFTGMTCYDAISALASLPNYEWGFKADETFFFRQKSTTSDSQMALSYNTNVSAILSLNTNFERVYSVVRATHGAYSAEVTDDGNFPSSPLRRFNRKILELASGDLLVKQDVDIATYAAQQFYAYYSMPRRAYKLATKFLPQLDLADVITLNYLDAPAGKGWYWGDTNVYWGQTDICFWGGTEQPAVDLLAKVVGVRYDTENWKCELDVEEILL